MIIVDHHYVGMGQVISRVKFLLKHGPVFGIVGILFLQCFEHHPLAMLACRIDIVILLAPLGQKREVAPFPRRVVDMYFLLLFAEISPWIHVFSFCRLYVLLFSLPVGRNQAVPARRQGSSPDVRLPETED